MIDRTNSAARPGLLPVRGVIFDLGGTLIRTGDYEGTNTVRLLEWASRRGLRVPGDAARVVAAARGWMFEETFRTGRQRTAREAIARVAEALDWPVDDGLLDQATRAFFEPEVEMVQAFPDATEVLRGLHGLGLRLGLISNASDHVLVVDLVARTNLGAWLDPVVSSAAFGQVKPSPAIFASVLEAWGLDPWEAVMVGDNPLADVLGAQESGMRAILVTMAAADRPTAFVTPAHPDAVAASLTEAAAIIRRWAAGD